MQNIQTLSIPENVQNSGIIPLSQWNKYFAYPCVGTLRQMIFYKKYGIERCISRIGGRIYVKVAEFFKWLEEQNNK